MKQFPIPSAPAPSGGERKPEPIQNYAKGGNVKTACYAEGGMVLGRSRSFLKETSPYNDPASETRTYPGKSTPASKAKGDKSRPS